MPLPPAASLPGPPPRFPPRPGGRGAWVPRLYPLAPDQGGVPHPRPRPPLRVAPNPRWEPQPQPLPVVGGPGAGKRLTGRVEIDDAYLGGERSGGKRGRGAPGKTPIIVAMETTPEGQPVRLKLRRVNGFRRKEVKKLARRSLDPSSTVVSDGLACFRGVTDAGCTHQPIRTGSGRPAVRTPPLQWVHPPVRHLQARLPPPLPALPPEPLPPFPAGFPHPLHPPFRPRRLEPPLGWAAVRTPPMPYRLLKLAEAHA